MKLCVVGISHKKCPIGVREKFFLRPLERELLLTQCKSDPAIAEAFVLSTCNRTEIYAYLIDDDPAALAKVLFKIKNVPFEKDWDRDFYVKSGSDVVRHLLSVSCGLDSLVLGEKQILGQVKEAIDLARKAGMMDRVFNVLSNIAIRTGKIVQSQTELGFGGSSVSWAAVAMAQKVFGSLSGKNVLIIGAGKMSQLAASQLSQKSVGEVYVMNRSLDKAGDLARQIGGKPVSFWDMKEILADTDICICSAGAPHYLVEHELVGKIMARRQDRNLLMIDISTPRNIDPAVASIAGVQLLSIDDLEKVVADTIEKRRSAVDEVEALVEQKVEFFYQKISKLQDLECAEQYVNR